ncbi:MAG: DNA mismatch repair protein MutS [Oscillospiraceae bacterium]|nr:DNA mismatch repair protein MutS [Oscillospiraceae bacterium]
MTPMMQQYLETKKNYKDCILFYRLGDFYEMFFEDALTASRELEITLTGKDCGEKERAPMCGVPFHSAESYISKLIDKGYKVAICEQMEDASIAKGLVKREVVRIVTPGTVMETNMLDEKKNNYIMSIFKKGTYFGLAVCDITTGGFYASQITEINNFEKLLSEIAKYSPKEIIINDLLFSTEAEINIIRENLDIYITKADESTFKEDSSNLNYEFLHTNDEKVKDLKQYAFCIPAINALLDYLNTTQKVKLEHINKIYIYNVTEYMALDVTARRNLELTERMRESGKKGTLLWVLDNTSTSMGARELRRWINEPLLNSIEINKRLDAVEELKREIIAKDDLIMGLKKVYDIERLIGKIAFGNANGRDLISLKSSISQIPNIKNLLQQFSASLLKELFNNLDELQDIYKLIDDSIVEEPPISLKDGDLIKFGYNAELDEYKTASTEGKQWLLKIEANEKEKTGIKNLKISYNKIFGYYLEVTKSYLNLVPDTYIRKQTLANCERYVTPELKELEEKILNAGEKMCGLEYEIFLQIRQELSDNILRIQKTANIISSLDVLISFAIAAEDLNYVKPEITNSGEIEVKEGRHPVIEKMLPTGTFISNDTYLDNNTHRFSIITGPNMAGKSTYMRQIALITIMAQIGSFVPAKLAKIGVVDKIFTRIGASDDLSIGQSTFMVEMMEVANIIKNCTSKSLVLLDEIGRGTSTYDGLAIAWAVVEYMADKDKCGAKTLFATHYHELIGLEDTIDGIKNYSIAVKENGEDIIFLRKIVEGGTDDSYGIHVAKLAGVSPVVTKRANEILKNIERKSIINSKTVSKTEKELEAGQLDFYNIKLAEIAHELDKINLDELTPISALNILVKMKEKMK